MTTLLLSLLLLPAGPSAAAELRVLTLNIQTDASNGRLPGIVDLIRRSKADIVGLQECEKVAADIAKPLGFNYRQVGGDTAVLSRYEISADTSAGGLVTIALDKYRRVQLLDLHLYYKPYQPYQLLGIPYDGRFISTEAEAIEEARLARGKDVDAALEQLRLAQKSGLPAIVVGDFNEPSHLDWTAAAANAKRHPIKVAWPQTKAFETAGFTDAYRELFPDELARPGYTWTPTTSVADPKDHHDRIDFILYRGRGLRAKTAQIVGESPDTSDVVLKPYPTDHRAVLATFVAN